MKLGVGSTGAFRRAVVRFPNYWDIGNSAVFTATRSGKLWFGFNDAAVTMNIGDNHGQVMVQWQFTHP